MRSRSARYGLALFSQKRAMSTKGEPEMSHVSPNRVLRLTIFLLLPLSITHLSAFAQTPSYSFNSGDVSSSATSMSNGAYGGPYYVEGNSSAGGFQDDGSSAIDTLDAYG